MQMLDTMDKKPGKASRIRGSLSLRRIRPRAGSQLGSTFEENESEPHTHLYDDDAEKNGGKENVQ
jgi:hypothetical protein